MNVTAEYMDGAGVIAWLEERHLLDTGESLTYLGERFRNAVHRWKSSHNVASVYLVDELLCSLGVCLGELPDELYRNGPVPGGRSLDDGVRERIVALRRLKWTQREIAAIVGVDQKTVRVYLRKAGL